MTQVIKTVKDFVIYPDNTMGYKRIKNKGSGAVPVSLSGLYTTSVEAENAINAYQPKRGAKKRDVEDNTTA